MIFFYLHRIIKSPGSILLSDSQHRALLCNDALSCLKLNKANQVQTEGHLLIYTQCKTSAMVRAVTERTSGQKQKKSDLALRKRSGDAHTAGGGCTKLSQHFKVSKTGARTSRNSKRATESRRSLDEVGSKHLEYSGEK